MRTILKTAVNKRYRISICGFSLTLLQKIVKDGKKELNGIGIGFCNQIRFIASQDLISCRVSINIVEFKCM